MPITHPRWIAAKYIVLTSIALLLLWAFTLTTFYADIQVGLADLSHWIANEEGVVGGAVGLFFLALVANTSILVQIPYSIPLMNIAFISESVSTIFILSVATGAGAGIGEINSYLIARGLTAPIQSPENSSFYRWIQRSIKRHPRTIPWLIFIASASVLPDDAIIWPLAIVKYPVKKILLPMFVGKIINNFFLAMLAFYSVQLINLEEVTIQVDFTIGILIVFIMFILYQIERNRVVDNQTPPIVSTD